MPSKSYSPPKSRGIYERNRESNGCWLSCHLKSNSKQDNKTYKFKKCFNVNKRLKLWEKGFLGLSGRRTNINALNQRSSTFCFPGTPSLILKISEDPFPNWNCSFAGFIASLLKISLQKMHSGLLKYSTLYPRSLIFPVADRFELMINLWTDKRWRTFPVRTKLGVNRWSVVACNMRWRCDLLKPQNY